MPLPGDDPEARRLAQEVTDAKREVDERREADIAQRRREEGDRDFERGKREGQVEAATKKQDEQILSLEQMYGGVLAELKGMSTRLEKLETTLGLFLQGAKVAADKSVSSRQFWLGVAAIAVAIFAALYGHRI